MDGEATVGNFTLEWSLAVPCAGNPNPGNTEASVAAACSGVDFTLSVQNPVELGWGYQWEYSDDGGFTWLPGATTATWLTNISVPTIFRCQVTCTSPGGGTVPSNDLLMNLNPPNQCYCEPLYTYGKTSGDLLSNVVIQGTTLANNTGTAPVNPAYTYFNTLPNHTATLQAGTSYTIQATVGTYSGQDIAVWIDFDEDGVFAHPGERVGYTTTSIGSNGTGSFILALPCNPVPGVKRMRVRDVWLQAGNTIDPCATYGFGETEDYDVTISAPPACPTPSGLAASAVTTTTASLNWVTGCVETDWIVEYGVTGFTLGSGTQVPVTGTPTLGLTLLSPATPYSVYVYADCEASSPGDGQSTPFGPVNFTTAALPPANDECVNAVGLTVNTDYLCGTVTAGTVAAATASGNALGSCFGTANDDVWYWFVATNTAHRVSLINLAGSSTDMYMKFYSGADCNTLVDFACSDPETANLTGLGIGTKYYVRVYGYYSTTETTTFNICVGTPPPPPANDDCGGAPSLPVSTGLVCAAQTAGTLESATNSGLLVSPCTGTVNNDVWYRFTATSNQHIITLSSAVPATTMYMQLFSGACGGLVHMACATTAAYTTPNTLVPTQEYYLRVYSSGSTAVTTTFNICVTTPPVGPPANDNCAGALPVTVNAGQTCASQTFGSVFGATASGQVVTPCVGTADDDVWFSFVASGPVHTVSLNSVTGSVTSMNFNVFSGTCAGPLTNIGCGATGTAPTTTIGGLTNGSTYYVRVYTNTAVAGQNTTFNVCVTTPPVNDQCAGAIAVGCNSITSSTTVGASNLNPPATCNFLSLNTAGGIWYTLPGFDGTMTVDLSGSSFDTKVAVFTGSCGSLVCVDSDDDGGTGSTSLLTWAGSSAETYTIYVTGFSTSTGSVTMAVTCGDNAFACAENGLTLEFQTDANPAQTTWQLWNEADDLLVLSGGPLNPANSVETNFGCVPDGCYRLRVLDSGGDGMTTGGYILRTTGSNLRIIDNKNNFNGVYDGNVSTLGSGAFCFPMDVVNQPIYSSCDKLDWVTNKFIVATEDPAVTAAYATPALRTSSGYLFWFFDPNGSYSFRRFRKHSESDGYGTGALRANHFRINSWANTPSSPHLPDGVLLNVRIMGRVNWSWTTWGPACQFKMDAALAACPRVNLQDNPNLNEYSCGVNRVFGGSNDWTNRVTASQPQPVPGVSSSLVRYQFRFRIPGEAICIIRPPQTSPRLFMNWSADSGEQLECGKQYEVDVRVSLDGGANWCFDVASPACVEPVTTWGNVCMVNITTSTYCPGPLQGGSSSMATQNGDLTMYPNPNRGDQLYINLSAVDADVNTVSVDIYDLTGKRISARTIAVQDGFLNTVLDLNGEIASGLYMVNITAGDKTYTERLVIQK
ncbi:MAG: T9SS type A sorting domain-containing protein [Flavobacteriales bacterium]|nr:T9SS type A sorting domain-containing protein [Flavobacteriales bacterium]